jgi:hypothetical protein
MGGGPDPSQVGHGDRMKGIPLIGCEDPVYQADTDANQDKSCYGIDQEASFWWCWFHGQVDLL